MTDPEPSPMPTLRIVDSYDEMSLLAADRVTEVVRRAPAAAITVPTGETPLGMFRELVRRVDAGLLDFAQTHVFCLDEFLGAAPSDSGSLTAWLREAFLAPAGVPPANIHTLPSTAADPDEAAARYEEEITARGGLALAVIGLGQNGHVAFNEPGSEPDGRTRVVDLTAKSRAQSADYWDGQHAIPARAITVGLGTILAAERLILIVSGDSKADTLRRTLEEPMTSDLPASWLRLAADRLEIIADTAAAKRLAERG